MAISLFITSVGVSSLIESVLARDRSSSLSVGACRVDCIPDIFRGVNFSARAERGVTMVFWTPRGRALRFPLGTGWMSLAGRIPLSKFRRTDVWWPVGRRSTSVVLGPVHPLVLPAVLCASKDGNSWLSADQWSHLLSLLGWFHSDFCCLFRRKPPPGSVELWSLEVREADPPTRTAARFPDPPLVSEIFLSLSPVYCHNSTNHPLVLERGPCSLVGIGWLCAPYFHTKNTPALRSVAGPSSELPPVTIGRTGRVLCLSHHRPPGFRSSVPVSPCEPPLSFVPESESHSADFWPRNHSSP